MDSINVNPIPSPGAPHGNLDALRQLDQDHDGRITQHELRAPAVDIEHMAGLSADDRTKLRAVKDGPNEMAAIEVTFSGRRVSNTDQDRTNAYDVVAGQAALQAFSTRQDRNTAKELLSFLLSKTSDPTEMEAKVALLNDLLGQDRWVAAAFLESIGERGRQRLAAWAERQVDPIDPDAASHLLQTIDLVSD